MQRKSATPTRTRVVLAGAGASNLVLLKKLSMHPLEGTEVVVVDTGSPLFYSARIPLVLAHELPLESAEIDIASLCKTLGFVFLQDKVKGIYLETQSLILESRGALSYDVVSLNVGLEREKTLFGEKAIAVSAYQRLFQLAKSIEAAIEPQAIAIAGGGFAGIEMALALRKRFSPNQLKIELFEKTHRLTPQESPRFSKRVLSLLTQKRITVHTQSLFSPGEMSDPFQFILDATPGKPPLWLSSYLNCDATGRIRVSPTLQVDEKGTCFAAGDSVAVEMHRGHFVSARRGSGVYAVRQGKILGQNILRRLAGKRSRRVFKPRRLHFLALHSAHGRALMRYGCWIHEGRLAYWGKLRADDQWMQSFQKLAAGTRASENSPSSAHEKMRCGGCGAKVPQDILQEALSSQGQSSYSHFIRFGMDAAEDACVIYAPRGEPSSLTQAVPRPLDTHSVDFFRAFHDDYYVFGQIAAHHSLNDIWAMNSDAHLALALVTVPLAAPHIQRDWLRLALKGSQDVFQHHQVAMGGGHTSEGMEFGLGFCVSGSLGEHTPFTKDALQPGDCLFLSKPLGTGVLMAAFAAGRCKPRWAQQCMEGMLMSNRPLQLVLRQLQVHAATDVSGFGLAGHLGEMLERSRATACLRLESIPLYKGFKELATLFESTLAPANRRVAARYLESGLKAEGLLFDPQTAGGFLFGLHPTQVETLRHVCTAAGIPVPAQIGVVTQAPSAEKREARITFSPA